MLHNLEKEVILPHVTINLATISWTEPSQSPRRDTHALFQRLSREHSPLRLGDLSVFDLLPRVHAVGFLPAGEVLPLELIETPLQVLTCFFDINYVSTVVGMSAKRLSMHVAALAVLRNKRLEMLMQELLAELLHPGQSSHFLMTALTDVMLVEVARFVIRAERRSGDGRSTLALAPWQLLRIEERINAAREHGYPTLGELACLCSISEGHLARAFKASTGWQLQKYVSEQRIRTACRMLAEDDMGCEAIASALGFSSAAYFSTVFRERTGRTPSDFRRQAKASKPLT